MKLRFYDWVVLAVLIVVAVNHATMIALLAAILGLLYLLVRFHINRSRVIPTATASNSEENEFVIRSEDRDGAVDAASIEVDIDISYHPMLGHFRLNSRFDLESWVGEYEYKIDGTSVSARLLNSYDRGESTHFREEWEVRDGVVLESDIRTRWEAKEFKWGSINEKTADLKKQTEWNALAPWSWSGFPYYLVNRALPAPDARRYLRQELERLKVGMAKAIPEMAKYGLEPDPNPDGVGGLRWIGGQKPEDANTEPFWETVKSGAFGLANEEVGESGTTQVACLQELLGDVVHCSKCGRRCLRADHFCSGCGKPL